MQNTYSFRELENAVLYAGDLLNLGVSSVLIQTIQQKPLEDYYVVSVIEDSDGITKQTGSEKQPTTLTIPPSYESDRELLKLTEWVDPY